MITPVKLWRRQKHTSLLIGKTGKILQWTLIRIPGSHFMSQAPYPVVIVKMNTGENMIGQLVDATPEQIAVGTPVIAVLRKAYPGDKEGVIHYTIKFRPI